MAKFLALSTRQSSGVESWGWKFCLWILGFLVKNGYVILIFFLAVLVGL